jgi:endonuclease/exonuclease/phosphatase family metal-dependent hydrolase
MVRQFADQGGLIRRTSLPTWPVSGPGLPQLAIDHMFADRELLFPDGVITGRYAGSDHLPIFARVLVPVPGQASAESDTVKDVAHVIAD